MKLSKNILKEVSVLMIILLMFFSSTMAMVNIVDKQTPILMADEHDSSLESEQRYTSDTQTKLQTSWIEDFEGTWFPGKGPADWTQRRYSGTGWWIQEDYSSTLWPRVHPYGSGSTVTGKYADAAWNGDVGLFTPALDLSLSSPCCQDYRLEYQYCFLNMYASLAEVRVWSGGNFPPDDPSFNAQLEEGPFLIQYVLGPGFWMYDHEVLVFHPNSAGYLDPTKVYIEFYFEGWGHEGKFAIDDVKIAPGGIWCVDVNNGDDSYNGLYQTYMGGSDGPFKTISKAVSVCIDCDTILVAGGTYVENVEVTIPGGVSIIGVDGPSLTFVTGGVSSHAFYLKSDCNTIEGFTIQNSLYGINIHDSDSNHIINNVIKDNDFGIIMDNAKDNIIEENKINSNIKDGVNIWELCSNNVIRTNHIESNDGYGVFIHSTSDYNTIYNNYFDNANNAWDENSAGTNQWYIPITPGTNIMGGTELGGNYWNDPPWNTGGTSPYANFPRWILPHGSISGPPHDKYPIPGFELVAVIIAIAIALIILRRKNKIIS